jgi:hypothetical protein
MRWLPIAFAMLGCGGRAKPPVGNECGQHGCTDNSPHSDEDREKAEHSSLCNRAFDLAGLGCEPFDRMDPSLLRGACNVVTSFQLAGMDRCLYEKNCADLSACFAKTRAADAPAPYRGPTRACSLPKNDADLGLPAGFSKDEMAQSYGADAHTYADAPSTKDQPIEVCGFPAAGAWLARMTCKDGSHPLATRNDAERMRVGNAGEGGRCGRIIDQYAVECPESTYDIFIDAYRCERR